VIHTVDQQTTPDPTRDAEPMNPGASNLNRLFRAVGNGQPEQLPRFVEFMKQHLGRCVKAARRQCNMKM
jgi:hypothetical protein